jgi:acyl dehydratase
MSRQYLEDFAIGQVYHSGRLRVDKDQIMAFAAQFDPQSYHLDEEAARKSVFVGLVASGWHTAALTMRLLVDGEFRPAGGILGVGFDELSWPAGGERADCRYKFAPSRLSDLTSSSAL